MWLWFNRHQHLLSTAITCLLLAGCAWLIGAMVWLPVTDSAISVWQAQLNEVTGSSSSVSRVNADNIKQRNLFGQYQIQSPVIVEQPIVQNAPETKLSLNLVGVVSVEPQQKSLAIIANKGKQDTYGVGESIEGTRAKVVAVYPDRIVINNAGRDETLMLLDEEYNRINNRTESVPQPLKPSHINYDEGSQSANESLSDIKQQVTENPTQLFQYVRFSMLKRDGQVVGYRLSPGRSPELFDSVGLKQGDIATKINGIELSDENALSQLMPSMQDLTEVNLTVLRDGEPYEIYIQF